MADDPELDKSIRIEVGKVYLARIEDYNPSQGGLAKIGTNLVFVKGARPGEDVRIRITKVLGRFAFGEIED